MVEGAKQRREEIPDRLVMGEVVGEEAERFLASRFDMGGKGREQSGGVTKRTGAAPVDHVECGPQRPLRRREADIAEGGQAFRKSIAAA